MSLLLFCVQRTAAGRVVVMLVSTAAGHVGQAMQHVMQPGMDSIAQRQGVLG